MSFTSYAQNFEDVMLWRALGKVKNGFFIDVGAWSPEVHSVTKAFSLNGWRGINIEPNPHYHAQLAERRPNEINLRVAVGDRIGTVAMNFIEDTGLSTADASVAERHMAAGWSSRQEQVEMTTLAAIWCDHVPEGRTVHFLKIDVEGLETQVIAGNDWKRNRPWVVVVEATQPLSQIASHADWEHMLKQAGYLHCYADGLNRFYVSEEHPELLDAFKFPPNVFDQFATSELLEQVARADAAEAKAIAATDLLADQEGKAIAATDLLAKVQHVSRARLDEAEKQLLRARETIEEFARRQAEVERLERESHQRASAQAVQIRAALASRDEAVAEAHRSVGAAMQQYHAIQGSPFWRLTGPLRRLSAKTPASLRRQARRAFKAAWWAVTPWRLPQRRRFIRDRDDAARRLAAETGGGPHASMPAPSAGSYAQWISGSERRSAQVDLPASTELLVSFLITGVSQVDALLRTLGSLRAQPHRAWEVLLCGGPELDSAATSLIERQAELDSRVVFLRAPGTDASECLQALLARSKGQYVALLDEGDLLASHALGEIASALRRMPVVDILYSDEDEQSRAQHRDAPYFKPGWSPDLLYAFNYFGRLTLLRRELALRAGAVDGRVPEAAEWDLNLRVSDLTQEIHRIPKVLCHRRQGSDRGRPGGASPEAADNRRIIEQYWQRQGFQANAQTQPDGTQRVAIQASVQPLVSIIIPTKDKVHLLRMCLDGLLLGTDYDNKEIVVVDTGSTEPETLAYYQELAAHREVRIVHFEKKFNYSAACNYGAACARGEMFLFLNNDIEVISCGWLQEMVGFALRPGVGVVGTKLIFPTLELQHGGVGIGPHLCALMFRSGGGAEWGVFGSPDHPRNWLAIMGACQLVRRDAFERVHGFDEAYLIAMSDVALCLQIWRAGYRTAYAPDACLVHHEGATRGGTNPAEDMRRIADDIRILGIDEDPYLHPELDGNLAIPTFRIGAAPTPREVLKGHIETFGTFPLPTSSLDLTDDGQCMACADLPRELVLWPPQELHRVSDKWSAARWCLDLLRTRKDIRTRFPKALSEGASGGFAAWLLNEGKEQFGMGSRATDAIAQLFAEDFAMQARQTFLFRADARYGIPHGLTPSGQYELFRWFMRHGRQETELRIEEIWWLFWQSAETPAEELIRAYLFTPAWQKLYPAALTVFGRDAFATWFTATYRAAGAWTDPSQWPLDVPPATQLREAFHANESWRTQHPEALHDTDAAVGLIEWLQADTRPSAGVRAWCRSLEKTAVAQALVAPGVNVIGHFCYPCGLRVSVEALVGALESVGAGTSLRDLRTDPKDDPHHVTFDGLEEFDVTIIHTQPVPFFDEAYQRADLAERNPRTYRIAYWYWEFDSIPEFWLSHAAQVDEVWAATEFVAKGLRERLPIPVRTMFPGVKLGAYTQRGRDYFGIDKDKFTFLFTFHMMSIMERKNPLGLIRAFKAAFDPAEPVNLVLKTTFGDRHPDQIVELQEAAAGSNIKIIDQVFNPDEVLSLMDVCDAYVSLHRSEGLGLTIAEAMLMGKPVIATNYSGNVDFMDDTNSLPVSYKITKLDRPLPPYDANSSWAEPSLEDAVRCMRKVYDDQVWARELGARAKASAEANLSLGAAGLRMSARLAEIRGDLKSRRRT